MVGYRWIKIARFKKYLSSCFIKVQGNVSCPPKGWRWWSRVGPWEAGDKVEGGPQLKAKLDQVLLKSYPRLLPWLMLTSLIWQASKEEGVPTSSAPPPPRSWAPSQVSYFIPHPCFLSCLRTRCSSSAFTLSTSCTVRSRLTPSNGPEQPPQHASQEGLCREPLLRPRGPRSARNVTPRMFRFVSNHCPAAKEKYQLRNGGSSSFLVQRN